MTEIVQRRKAKDKWNTFKLPSNIHHEVESLMPEPEKLRPDVADFPTSRQVMNNLYKMYTVYIYNIVRLLKHRLKANQSEHTAWKVWYWAWGYSPTVAARRLILAPYAWHIFWLMCSGCVLTFNISTCQIKINRHRQTVLALMQFPWSSSSLYILAYFMWCSWSVSSTDSFPKQFMLNVLGFSLDSWVCRNVMNATAVSSF